MNTSSWYTLLFTEQMGGVTAPSETAVKRQWLWKNSWPSRWSSWSGQCAPGALGCGHSACWHRSQLDQVFIHFMVNFLTHSSSLQTITLFLFSSLHQQQLLLSPGPAWCRAGPCGTRASSPVSPRASLWSCGMPPCPSQAWQWIRRGSSRPSSSLSEWAPCWQQRQACLGTFCDWDLRCAPCGSSWSRRLSIWRHLPPLWPISQTFQPSASQLSCTEPLRTSPWPSCPRAPSQENFSDWKRWKKPSVTSSHFSRFHFFLDQVWPAFCLGFKTVPCRGAERADREHFQGLVHSNAAVNLAFCRAGLASKIGWKHTKCFGTQTFLK